MNNHLISLYLSTGGIRINNRRNELAPCGVFCATCPSFSKSCLGCASENKDQKRVSKWNCKIRKCCYEELNIDYCGYCHAFPCNKIKYKLINSHKGDARFKYRHEITKAMEMIKQLGVEQYIISKRQESSCPVCRGIIYFYHYKCSQCGRSIITWFEYRSLLIGKPFHS